MTSLARSWVSVSLKRARTLVASEKMPVFSMPAALSAPAMRSVVAAVSSLSVALALDTCTAGTSP
ncbi:MAG: hypothetical protein BWZ09_02394 [Alphaproteobacteria bacterium ADurb.BinA305]|nr:MAG: hypothetical protein BWZ09_02394 [Alphaproteobacteria bacterium ADurb.BinA305]